MTKIVNIPSQIVVQTAAQWAADNTVYSNKRLLVTSDAYYGSTDQRKFKIADGTQTWSNLDYFPLDVALGLTLAQVLANGNETNQLALNSNSGEAQLNLLNAFASFGWFGTKEGSVLANDDSTIIYHDDLIELNATSVQKNGAEVLTSANITSTITNGDTTHTPSSDAVYDALALKLAIANNLSDLNSAATARVNLGIDKITNGGNAAYNILATDKIVYTGTALTAARIWTLPSASSVNAGYEIIVADFLQTITSTNTITIAVQTGQVLNGVTNGTEVINAAGGWRRLVSDGSTKWSFDAGIARLGKDQTFAGVNTFSQAIVASSETASTIASFDASKNIKSLATSTYPSLTELSYVKGVTSALQTQLDAKLNYFQSGFTSTLVSPADGTVAYNMPLIGGGVAWSVSKYTGASFPLVGTITAIQIIGFHSIAATNESVSFYLRNETTGTDYTITTSWDDSYAPSTYKTRLYTGLSIPIGNTTDLWLLKLVNPTWSINPTNWVFSFGYIIKY